MRTQRSSKMATLKSREPVIWAMIQIDIYGPCMRHVNGAVLESNEGLVTYNLLDDALWAATILTADHIRTTLINTLSALTMRNH
jgi:hypothetical protein